MVEPDIELEKSLWSRGYRNVFGIDEVGRGPLAGPIVAGCVVINSQKQVISGVRDSKMVSKIKREGLSKSIMKSCTDFGVGVVEVKELDTIGVSKAVKLAMIRAIESVRSLEPDYLIVDGKNVLPIDKYLMDRITRGDMLHYSIAAASIIAKVYRDNLMVEYSKIFPEFGFEKHSGYGTKFHLDAIKRYGVCDIHRKSFRPIKELLI